MKQWKFEKFQGDMAIYGFCPNCNYSHVVSSLDEYMTPYITNQYIFCPCCGEYLFVENPENAPVTKNERHILDYYYEEINEEAVKKAVARVLHQVKENEAK